MHTLKGIAFGWFYSFMIKILQKTSVEGSFPPGLCGCFSPRGTDYAFSGQVAEAHPLSAEESPEVGQGAGSGWVETERRKRNISFLIRQGISSEVRY